MEIDETCLSNSYKSMNDFFEEMELDSELLYQFYLAFRGQQISFPMKMYDRELVRKRIENMIEQEKTVDIRQLTEVYGFSARLNKKTGDEYMAKLIVLGGLIYGGYWLYKYMLAHPNIDKGKVIKTVGVIIVGLIALTKKNNTNSPKIMRTYRCRGCGREISTSFNPSESPQGRDRCHAGYRHSWERIN